MARRHRRPEPTTSRTLEPCQTTCWVCGQPMWIAYHNNRTLMTLDGLVHVTLKIRRCMNKDCT